MYVSVIAKEHIDLLVYVEASRIKNLAFSSSSSGFNYSLMGIEQRSAARDDSVFLVAVMENEKRDARRRRRRGKRNSRVAARLERLVHGVLDSREQRRAAATEATASVAGSIRQSRNGR